MTDKQIIHGEQVPLITLTRQQLEEDWFTLWELYKAKEQECEELKNFHINLVGVKECEIKELLQTEFGGLGFHIDITINHWCCPLYPFCGDKYKIKFSW